MATTNGINNGFVSDEKSNVDIEPETSILNSVSTKKHHVDIEPESSILNSVSTTNHHVDIEPESSILNSVSTKNHHVDIEPESSILNSVSTKKFDQLEKYEDRWEEVKVPVPWGHVAGKWWGPRNIQPVLCLHGWQDNAGTFDNLIPLLPETQAFFCIDLPGHGLSSPYPPGQQYYLFWDGICLIRRIVKFFKWTDVVLMGHSLGGALSFMYAACFPAEINSFISLDIAGPTVRDSARNAALTGDCLDKFLKYETLPVSKTPCYSYDDMIQLVLEAYEGSVTRESCKVLMRRGMAPAPLSSKKDGYHFARDLRLKVSLLGMMTMEQVLAYASQITCRVLNIRGLPGMKFENTDYYSGVLDTIRKTAKVEYHEIEGTHHLHLNTPERISEMISSFLEPQRQ